MTYSGMELTCPSIGLNTQYRTNPEWTKNVMNWVDCSKLCRDRAGCQYWTWHKSGSDVFKCVTMTGLDDNGYINEDKTTVSGDRNCKYLLHFYVL